VVDLNRDVSGAQFIELQQRDSSHSNGEALEHLHSNAFRETMTFDNIRSNRMRCRELFFLHERAVLKKTELSADSEFKDHDAKAIEALVVSDFNNFAQRMCRRAMIRNYHFIKWFKATMQDEFIKYYLIPIGSFFAARYFKVFDHRVTGQN
jgi:hypothetical protein